MCVRTVVVPPEVRDRYLAWIATPEREALTVSDVHRAVDYRPITRYDAVGGDTPAGPPLEVLPCSGSPATAPRPTGSRAHG